MEELCRLRNWYIQYIGARDDQPILCSLFTSNVLCNARFSWRGFLNLRWRSFSTPLTCSLFDDDPCQPFNLYIVRWQSCSLLTWFIQYNSRTIHVEPLTYIVWWRPSFDIFFTDDPCPLTYIVQWQSMSTLRPYRSETIFVNPLAYPDYLLRP